MKLVWPIYLLPVVDEGPLLSRKRELVKGKNSLMMMIVNLPPLYLPHLHLSALQ
jgi:hypothetical protein